MNDETRERLRAMNERIKAAMDAAHINPATGAPYTAEEIAAIKNAGVTGGEAGAAFRDFINTLDVSGLKADPVCEMHEAYEQGKRTPLQASSGELRINGAIQPDTTGNQLSNEAAQKLYEEMRERLSRFQSGHWLAAAFIGVDFTAAGERAYRAQIEAEEGAEFVAQAEEIARTSMVDFYGAVRFLRQRRAAIEAIQRLGQSVQDLGAGFAAIGKAIGNGVQAGTQGDADAAPCNRHDRRASRHSKPIKKDDEPYYRRKRRR